MGVRRFVHVSSLSAREPQLSNYGRSKERGEAEVRHAALDWTIVRPPAVYGPGDLELRDVFRMARLGLALLPPPPAAASKNPHHQHQRPPFAYGPTPSGGTGTTTESSSEERRGPLAPAPRKRSRTTFTREQKEQMLAFAERVGWRMQRQDEAAVEHFCAHAGVRRQALKVWMHNNKQSSTAGRRQQQPQEEEKLQELRQEQQQ
jgi:ZF-HD class homeobox domain-containing protein